MLISIKQVYVKEKPKRPNESATDFFKPVTNVKVQYWFLHIEYTYLGVVAAATIQSISGQHDFSLFSCSIFGFMSLT